jgi:hypothetical protein
MADGDSMDIPGVRAFLALQASWEIESIAKMVHNHIEGDAENLVYLTLMRRCKKLNSLIMSALGEPAIKNAELQSMLVDGEFSHG